MALGGEVKVRRFRKEEKERRIRRGEGRGG